MADLKIDGKEVQIPQFGNKTSGGGTMTGGRFTTAFKDYVAFVNSDHARSKFTTLLYRVLMHCFSHIAHTDIDGFYEQWFRDTAAIAAWYEHMQVVTIYPISVYHQFETELRYLMKGHDLLEKARKRCVSDARQAELLKLRDLIKKYPAETARFHAEFD
jgi:hypothetical protein